ncbi:hypothetical protein RFI_00971 [Reticulomyxa filosa]|uniref:Metallo-beta-lactamase domain-containing protein n=1 Tax=Reticulomyxa filosa TaxID=46433 RepID=X6PCZ1_RETFI|nr:hypothetical protein RFI_00971 [Reticulomyxa filosa]|eukprot:ETO36086.1 hypothetical protein RFI_00971 [Reticulomyxa filosa]
MWILQLKGFEKNLTLNFLIEENYWSKFLNRILTYCPKGAQSLLLSEHLLAIKRNGKSSGNFDIKIYLVATVTLSSGVSTSVTEEIERKLRHHKSEFNPPRIITVTDGVHVAVGFGLANSILIEAQTCSILVVEYYFFVSLPSSLPKIKKKYMCAHMHTYIGMYLYKKKKDTTESNTIAQEIYKAFETSGVIDFHSKPITHYIYTHFHPDHTQGTEGYIGLSGQKREDITIIAHSRWIHANYAFLHFAGMGINWRSVRQFGSEIQPQALKDGVLDGTPKTIEPEWFYHNGIGPHLDHLPTSNKSLPFPTQVLNSTVNEVFVENLRLVIYHAPGETEDQIFIHIPDKNVLLPADNIYKLSFFFVFFFWSYFCGNLGARQQKQRQNRAFPNLYAIRGSSPRPVNAWIRSLDMMRKLKVLRRKKKQLNKNRERERKG